MRGGLIACFGDAGPASDLELLASRLRWHRGCPRAIDSPGLRAILLVDGEHGPASERCGDRLFIVHGAPPSPAEHLRDSCRGRFAGLDWDGRRLLAIRDPMGEVPLFFRATPRAVWFATEIEALTALGDTVPDLEALSANATAFPYPERTGWDGIERVLPGEVLEIDRTLRVRRQRYWHPDRFFRQFRGPSNEANARFRGYFEDAVRRCLGRTTGILLSGGLDSSAIAVTASAIGAHAVLLGAGYPSFPTVDESRYATAVAEAARLPLHWIEGRLDRWRPGDDPGVPGLGLPTGNGDTTIPALAALGCDTVLDGHDGDGVLGNPFATHANALIDGQLHALAGCVRRGGLRSVVRTLATEILAPRLRPARLRGDGPGGDDAERFVCYFQGRTRARFLAEFRWRPPRRGWRCEQLRVLLPPFTQTIEELELDGARHGVDMRHPFADRDLVEFLVSLPHRVKTAPHRTKQVLRDGLADLLPALIADRHDKVDFAPVLDRRVDYGACLDVIRDAQVRLPDVDYRRLDEDTSDPMHQRYAWIRLAKCHAFTADAYEPGR